MPFITIPPGDVDQGSVVDESLMSGKVKNDLDDLNSRVVALEALSGGGVAASDAANVFAKIIAGGETNEGKFWKLRHYPPHSTLPGMKNSAGDDLEKQDVRERFMYDPKFTINSAISGLDTGQYLSKSHMIAQNEQLQFRIKKGENFFCIGTLFGTSSASIVRVYVDGVNANTVGLTDERGAVVSATINQNNATTYYGKVHHYYGLDGEEHVITVKNENASAQNFWFNFVDIGYRSPDYAIDHTIKINAGVAEVGNIAASFDEDSFTFTEPTEGLANGYTGMLKINESGAVTAVDGLSPARTEIKPNTAVAFSGAVTTLPVKNHFAFPDDGICLFQMPDGSKWFFSYNAKGLPGGPQTHSLDSILWQRQPVEDFTFLPNKAGAVFATNEPRGDGRIEYWAKAPILIDGTNNKIDFEITVNGTTTQHTGTVASGRYSADLVPLSAAIVRAMQTAKPINGKYFAMWNESSQLWSVGVNDPEVSQLDFEWATGANSATSLGPTLGFSSDSTGEKTYIAAAIKQHKAQRVFLADDKVRDPFHPSIKYNWTETTAFIEQQAEEVVQEHPDLAAYRSYNAGGFPFWDIYPDDDCTGLTLYFMKNDNGMYMTAMINGRDKIMLVQSDKPTNTSSPAIGQLVSCFVSFPKGTNMISVFNEQATYYEVEDNSNVPTFFGYRQHFTKPPWESLTPQEKVLKTFEVNPIRLFGTHYGHNTALYTPQASNDNINTITESGTWAQSVANETFNGKFRSTVTLNGYVEVEFVLQGDGGGIGLMTAFTTVDSLDVVMFLSNTTINETTDLIERDVFYWTGVGYDWSQLFHIGLKAGTYKARFKTQHATRLVNNAITIYDTVPPQLNAPTLTDIANTGQSVAFPLYTKRRAPERYGSHLVPSQYAEGFYHRGVVSHFDYIQNVHQILHSDITLFFSNYWVSFRPTNTSEYVQYTTLCRSICAMNSHNTTYSTVVQPSIDARNLNTVSVAAQVKGGSSPNASRHSVNAGVFFDFQRACTFNASLTYNITDTRGLRTGKAILVDNTGAKEEVYIASFVTDTSFTIAKALTILTPANVNKVLFWGMHNLRMTSGDNTDWYSNGFMFEPLPIEESILQARIAAAEYETVESLVETSHGAIAAGASSTVQLEWPIHSDGELGNRKTTGVALTRLTNSTGGEVIHDIDLRLKAMTLTNRSGVSTGSTVSHVHLKSRKPIRKGLAPLVRG